MLSIRSKFVRTVQNSPLALSSVGDRFGFFQSLKLSSSTASQQLLRNSVVVSQPMSSPRIAASPASTQDMYKSKTPVLVGKYAATRAKLDYNWHSHYVEDRIINVQDPIIEDALNNGVSMEKPWLVYTAGPMGAGKSHIMRWLFKHQLFPLMHFVFVDPDKIKDELPEMKEFLARDKCSAGTLTHAESISIAEIIEREAMAEGKCVLVDGSMRNSKWYMGYFQTIREQFPHYRIAIINVTASREVIYERARRRAEITNRVVPKEILDDAIENTTNFFSTLKPLVNFATTLDNDADNQPPVFTDNMTAEKFRDCWSDIFEIPIPEEVVRHRRESMSNICF